MRGTGRDARRETPDTVGDPPDRAADAPGTGLEASEHARVADFVSGLARAVQAFHTYPADSPARSDVIERLREKLHPCLADGAESLTIDVTNDGLTVRGERVHGDSGPERAFATALRRTYVSSLEFRAGTPTGDFRQFCALLAYPDQLLDRVEDLSEILTERGVKHITAHVISAHRTIDAGAVPEALLELVERQHEKAGGSFVEESAEGGWIRLDPSVPLDRVALEDLPLLLRDAPSLGLALHRMTGRKDQDVSAGQALITHYDEITRLYDACEESVAETLFRRLADVVRQLPDDAKMRLLKRDVLPGLVDGRRSGTILRHFAEQEIADALWLLLDLGVGGVEMLTAGLANLELSDGRLPNVIDRVADRLDEEDLSDDDRAAWLERLGDGRLRESNRTGSPLGDRLRMDDDSEGDYLALRTFDLSVDEEASAELEVVVRRIEESDPTEDALRAAADILALSADPTVATSVMRRARGLFFDLESRGDVGALAGWLARFARIARRHAGRDGEISNSVRDTLDGYVTPEFIHRVSAVPPEGSGEPPLVTIICELGATGVGALIDSLATESDRAARSRLLTALQPRADDLAEHLVDYLSHPKWYVVRNVLTLLGHAGAGCEDQIAGLIGHEHPRVTREALLGLARIGTEAAIEHTRSALRHASGQVRDLAAESLFRFESDLSHPVLNAVLADRDLARTCPSVVQRLLVDAKRRDVDGAAVAARRLRWHALAVWNAERRRLGWCAFRMAREAG